VSLKGGLNLEVPFGRDLQCRNEQALQVVGDRCNVLQIAFRLDFLDERIGVESAPLDVFAEQSVDLA